MNLEKKIISLESQFYEVLEFFPVIQNQQYSSRIHFLGYWLLKRKIPEVTLIISLRNQFGEILLREVQIINEPKAFSIDLENLLKEN